MIDKEYLHESPDAINLKCLLVQRKLGSLQSLDNDLNAVRGVCMKTCFLHLLIEKHFKALVSL